MAFGDTPIINITYKKFQATCFNSKLKLNK